MRVLLVPSGDIAPINSLEGMETLRRCQAALGLIRKEKFDKLVLAGGQCHAPKVETQTGAQTMLQWFEAQGGPWPPIILECESRDTYENISCTLKRFEECKEPLEFTVVSQWQHTLRFAITFWLAHRIRIKRVPLHYSVSLKNLTIEWGLIVYHLYDWRGTKWIARQNRERRTHR